jgi:hypothetical protein
MAGSWKPPTNAEMIALGKALAEIHRCGDEYFGGPGSYSRHLKFIYKLQTDKIKDGDALDKAFDQVDAFNLHYKSTHPEKQERTI